jgi:hypothetical protein
MIDIPPEPTDDPEFLELVRRATADLLKVKPTEEVFVTRIDNWFDQKWLNFSGIGRVRFDDFRIDIDTALDGFWQDKVTFPPFNPNRVVEQQVFLRDQNGGYARSETARLIHPGKRASSCENLQRRIADFSDSAVFVWFSSKTQSTLQGSLMVYEAYGSQVTTWYASFSKADEWWVRRADGIARDQLEQWIRGKS